MEPTGGECVAKVFVGHSWDMVKYLTSHTAKICLCIVLTVDDLFMCSLRNVGDILQYRNALFRTHRV